jgi:zinc transport system substrate-binding protein
MPRIRTLLLSASLLGFSSGMAVSADLEVMASIRPVHALVAGVMKDVGTPGLIVEGNASPHAYSLKPSQAAALQDADLVFWVGPDLETFLTKPLETIARADASASLSEAEGITRLAFRDTVGDDTHDHAHGDHGHDDSHDGHDHDKHDHDHDHDKEEHEAHDHPEEKHADGHDGHGHDHAHGATDPHIWLDPENAKAMTLEIAARLAKADPDNADRYRENAERIAARLDVVSAEIAETLAPVRDKRYVVFHDAYQYFEKRFGLAPAAAITLNPETNPGAARISEIKHRIEDTGAVCVFSEPQFDPKLVRVTIEGTDARTAVLDPLGGTLPDTDDFYYGLLRGMAETFRDCLAQQG